MIAILAEKPSVAREIAAIVGANKKKDGYLEGNNYLVTWAFGHLVQLAMPEEYEAKGFVREHLPIIPETFMLKPRQTKVGKEYKDDAGAIKQLKVIESVFNQCDKIIVATDAGREGELIFRHIYTYLGCKKPFDRLWISSLTEKAIREGLQNLKSGSEYDKLYDAAKGRSEADWLVGINASQALTIAAKQGVFSLGRVQTPTLAMVCSRYLENKNFVPTPFGELRLNTQDFSAASKERITEHAVAKELFENQQNQQIVLVKDLEKKEVSQEAPLLYDLTSLQKEANNIHAFSADKTLSIAQKLYESKYITYSRTGSRYISEDVFDEVPALIEKLTDYKLFASYANKLLSISLNTRSVNTNKVTDHHALLITGELPQGISGDEQKIYEMIAGRMLESFSQKCIKDQTTITLACDGVEYVLKGSTSKVAGWREVWNDQKENNEDEKELPNLNIGQELPISKIELLEKKTKPKALHTESSLLSSMETAGKDLEDDEQRLAIKECGIGTPATRASIIETLFARDYMKREKKLLVPTEKGLAVYEAVKDKRIADVEMTGMWENTFAKIESGEADVYNFKKGIEIYAAQITEELLNTILSLPQAETLLCPKCSTGSINFYPKVVKCSNADCNLFLFLSLCGKTLSNDVMQTLLSGKQTGLIKGLKSKAGKSFDAALVLDENFKIKFVFPKNRPKKR